MLGPEPSEPAEGEITVITGGFEQEPGLGGKLMPVRWQSIPVASGPPTTSRMGTVFAVDGRLWGARWATPHMEVGETAFTPEPRVTAMLHRLAEQDGIALAPRASPPGAVGALGRRRANPIATVVAESCDGLPIIGPLPGRPRVAVLGGLGVMAHTWLPLAADHLVAAMLGGPEVRLPACLGTARFR